MAEDFNLIAQVAQGIAAAGTTTVLGVGIYKLWNKQEATDEYVKGTLTELVEKSNIVGQTVAHQLEETRSSHDRMGDKMERLSNAIETRVRQHESETPRKMHVDELRKEWLK